MIKFYEINGAFVPFKRINGIDHALIRYWVPKSYTDSEARRSIGKTVVIAS